MAMAWRVGGRQGCKACRRSPMWVRLVIRRCWLDVWLARKRNDRAIYRKPGETGGSLSHAPLWGSYQSSARNDSVELHQPRCPVISIPTGQAPQRDKAELISDIILQAGAPVGLRSRASCAAMRLGAHKSGRL